MTQVKVHLECIVEGPGELRAAPLLVQRWLQRKQRREAARYAWSVDAVVAHGCDRIKHPPDPRRPLGVERFVAAAIGKGAHGVLVLIDADDEAPAELESSLLQRAQAAARRGTTRVPVGVAVANREYEAWLLADLWTLRRAGLFPPANRLESLVSPEVPRDCKALVRQLLGRAYEAPLHQPMLTAALSYNRGSRRRSPSFHRLSHVLVKLLREARRYALTHP
ncbi:MAG: DUF4276 family protein [Polyangiaceae bacterium]